jgi:peptidoglycan/LPS O-acetylase OafA/YrhL
MRSSDGQHFAGLDHVRALAAFLVVVWHFAHGTTGYPVPFGQAPELGLIDEGHVGVSIFMVLSGYLFARLIGRKTIHFPAFLWNRAIRLLPLLVLVLVTVGLRDYRDDPLRFLKIVAGGAVLPQLPNGGWSLTVEAHFYIILPVLLWATATKRWLFGMLLGLSLCFRLSLYLLDLDLKQMAYQTIFGRIDQFVMGVFFVRCSVTGRWAAISLLTIATVYYAFDIAGGYETGPYWAWIALPTIESVCFGALIAWYDRHPIRSPKMWLIQKAGEYSYSIYLLHAFFVFAAARFVDEHIMRLTSLYAVLPWAIIFFFGMTALGHFSFKLIEQPPVTRFRKHYIKAI